MFVFLTGAVGKKRKFCYIDFTLAYNSLVSAERYYSWVCGVYGEEKVEVVVFLLLLLLVGVCLYAWGGGNGVIVCRLWPVCSL